MQYEEVCKESVVALAANQVLINSLLEELEDFDGLVENPIWGEIQVKLLELRELYSEAPLVINKVLKELEREEEKVKVDYDAIAGGLADVIYDHLEDIEGVLEDKQIRVSVEVSPKETLH
jgi:hypothetical protein